LLLIRQTLFDFGQIYKYKFIQVVRLTSGQKFIVESWKRFK